MPCRSRTLGPLEDLQGGRPRNVTCRLGVSYDNLLDYNVYYLKILANHGSFIPLKYSLKHLITQHLQDIIFCFMIYKVYTIHVYCQETQIKSEPFCIF